MLDYELGNPLTSEFSEKKSEWKNGKDNGLKADDSQSTTGQKNKGCFICDGLHRAKDCPKREALNAMVTNGSREGSNSDTTRVNPLQLLNAIHVEKTTLATLMYIKLVFSGINVLGMVDRGATHNFISEKMVLSLGIKVGQSTSQIKIVNSVAQSVCGIDALLGWIINFRRARTLVCAWLQQAI